MQETARKHQKPSFARPVGCSPSFSIHSGIRPQVFSLCRLFFPGMARSMENRRRDNGERRTGKWAD
jgi:hypothetical protein